MADPGFQFMNPLIVLPRQEHFALPDELRQAFRSRRSMIERCFGIIKNSYSSVGTRRFRNRRWEAPIICNLTAAMYNRRRLIFSKFRNAFGLQNHYV